ncbi:DUF742 domain-containing protein [Nocardia sp. NPDC058658]|uniref:DUF742 domain-containing protein n=1 Tax=Nocardia sp. NPDC058658 TaxID=3346580 RepID=UPI003653A4DE
MTLDDDNERWWFDDAAGPVARPYTFTGGRTRSNSGIELDLVTLVVTAADSSSWQRVDSASAQLLRFCEHPLSVAEAAAGVHLPLRVVKVLLGDLIHQQLMLYRTGKSRAGRPDAYTMQRVIDGIRAL